MKLKNREDRLRKYNMPIFKVSEGENWESEVEEIFGELIADNCADLIENIVLPVKDYSCTNSLHMVLVTKPENPKDNKKLKASLKVNIYHRFKNEN